MRFSDTNLNCFNLFACSFSLSLFPGSCSFCTVPAGVAERPEKGEKFPFSLALFALGALASLGSFIYLYSISSPRPIDLEQKKSQEQGELQIEISISFRRSLLSGREKTQRKEQKFTSFHQKASFDSFWILRVAELPCSQKWSQNKAKK